MGPRMKTLKTRTENTTVDRTAIVVVGYPGAGKTTAAEFLHKHVESIMIETGDIVREGATQYYGKSVNNIGSHELGEYSTMRREQDGGDYVACDIIRSLGTNNQFPDNPAIICGMRDEEAYSTFADFFDTLNIVSVLADREHRLQRLQNRGKNDESEFTMSDLMERDAREDSWGTRYWMHAGLSEDHVHRYPVRNEATKEVLESGIKSLIRIMDLTFKQE